MSGKAPNNANHDVQTLTLREGLPEGGRVTTEWSVLSDFIFGAFDCYLLVWRSSLAAAAGLVMNVTPSSKMNAEEKVAAALPRLRDLLPELRERYGVDKLEVFGSSIRADMGEHSDLDLLVTFTETPDLLTFIALENELSERLSIPVDLVMRRALKPRLRDRILRESIPV